MANGGPATKGAEVGGAAPRYRKKSEGRTTTQDKVKTVGTGNLSGKGLGKTGYKGKAKVKKPVVQVKAAKVVMPGKRRSG